MARPLRGALASVEHARWRKKASASTTPWPTWWPGRSRCKIICTTSLGWFELDAELRAMCDRIIYNLDANGYLQGRLEDLIDPNAGPRAIGAGAKGAGRRAEARSAGRGGARSARVPAVAAHAGHALLRAAARR